MIGDYLPHSFVFARNRCAEDFDILSKLCSGGMPLAVIRDCLPALLDSEHCNWVVSTLEVLLLSHLPASHEKHLPDSWNGIWASAVLFAAMKHHLTSSSSWFCWIFAFSSLYRASADQVLVKTSGHTAEMGVLGTHMQTDTASSPMGAGVFWLQPLLRKLSICCSYEYNSSVNENGLYFSPAL